MHVRYYFCYVAVAAWATLGNIWEVCLASTEGLGEAASVRVSFYLAEGFPMGAKHLSSKVAFLAFVEGLVITSIILLAGPNIAEALTTDTVLKKLLNDLLGLTALANVPMTLAQVFWSLLGAQGKYAMASATILLTRWVVTIPISALFVFGYAYESHVVAGAVACGYATATVVLSLLVFISDWARLSESVQEDLLPEDDNEIIDILDSDDDDSSDGF